MKKQLLVAAVAAAVSAAAVASDTSLEEITVIGTEEDARNLPGSGAVVTNEQIRIEAANDINQLLKTVPGMYILEEDGYGLRPNIGVRGATSERSSKVTLMEDGVMVAPAPYSNPSAYYFPTMSRMHSIEILKGAPLLRFGPQTTGGVINMVSTPIPESNQGNIDFAYGQNTEMDLLADYGGRVGDFGYLVETAQRRSEGFKEIDRSNDDTGYEIEDYLVKLIWQGERQSVLLKAQYSEETSDETYLGLTDADFDRDPDRRYGLSEPDEMTNDHEGYNAVYRISLTEGLRMTVTGYYNEFSRDWFKLDSGNDFINPANEGDAFSQGVLDGTQDIEGLEYVHNNRDYESKGIELNFDWELAAHTLAFGGRVHGDEMDRFQPVDYYNQINGQLFYTGTQEPTGSNNRKEKADAYSFWALDSWQVNDAFNLNLALRYEDVDSERKQYADPQRSELQSESSNNTEEWLPGASFTYDLNETWQLLGGVHAGFSPLGGGARENEEPETSTNYEAGIRYGGAWFVEAIGFFSDFDNKVEDCSIASPCSNGATSGSYNTGKAEIYGLEVQAGTSMDIGKFVVPVEMMYTYTSAEVTENNPEEGIEDGDRLAVIPDNTFSLRAGIEAPNGWGNYAVVKYTDEMCMDVGCNRESTQFDRSEDLWVVDFISRYSMTPSTVVYLKVENVFDEQVIVSRQPDGARPNKPQTASVGVQWTF